MSRALSLSLPLRRYVPRLSLGKTVLLKRTYATEFEKGSVISSYSAKKIMRESIDKDRTIDDLQEEIRYYRRLGWVAFFVGMYLLMTGTVSTKEETKTTAKVFL